jgi:archaellum component FlaC
MKISLQEINNLLKPEVYYETIESLEDIIKENVNNSTLISDKLKVSQITNGKLLTLLCLAKPFLEFNKPITKEYFFDPGDIDHFDIYFDKIIDDFTKNKIGIDDVRKLQAAISWSLNRLSIFASKHVLMQRGVTINTFQIMDLAERDEEFRKTLLFTHAENNKDVDNIQERIENQNNNSKLSVSRILKDKSKYNSMKLLIKSGAGINTNQLAEVINNIGYKPDMRGKVIPTPIDTSVAKGLRNIEDFYTDAVAARKALTTSKTQVRQSGYLNRKISILTEDCHIVDIDDCGSKHYVTLNIKDSNHLKLLHKRFYVDENDEIKLINKNDKSLIGKTINLRSPITCACEDNGFCHTCYGEIWKINNTLNIGTIANLVLTDPMTQKLLSTKHLLKVEVKNFEWSDDFKDKFTIYKNLILPNNGDEVISISKDDLSVNENATINRYSTSKFYIYDKKGRKTEITSPVKLLVADENIEDIEEFYSEDDNSYTFTIGDLDTENMFKIVIQNVGVADPLLMIKDMLDTNAYIIDEFNHDYSLVLQEYVKLLNESKTPVHLVHGEVILACMTFFDFPRSELRDENLEIKNGVNQTMRNIKNSIYLSPSPVKSLLFEHVTKQLKTDSFNNLTAKNGSSKFDSLFLPKK